LLDLDSVPKRDIAHIPQFIGEANRRISMPFLLLAFALTSGCILLSGQIDRRGLGRKIMMATLIALSLQGAYLALFNLTKQHMWANIVLYVLPLSISMLCLYFLSPLSETSIKTSQKNKQKISEGSLRS
jgi:lipopolysaccharide export LptBFGC system permease protein LptF